MGPGRLKAYSTALAGSKPLIKPAELAARVILLKSCTIKNKKEGRARILVLKVQLLPAWKKPLGDPFIRIGNREEEMQAFIHVRHLTSRPISLKI